MNWNDIKQTCFDLLYLNDLSEKEEKEYSDKFRRFANQGLNIIANGVKPKIGEYTVEVYDASTIVTMPDDFISWGTMVGTKDGEPFLGTTYVARNKIRLDGETEYTTTTDTICQDGKTYYEYDADTDTYTIKEGLVVGTSSVVGLFEKHGTVYKILYNALWEEITQDDTKYGTDGTQPDLPQDLSILNILPQYICFNILTEDDIQRSVIMKNDFEIALSRLDTNELYDTEYFESEKGWY